MSAGHECGYPTCRDPRESTTEERVRRLLDRGDRTFCRPCTDRYRRVLGWVLEDYVQIAAAMAHGISGPAGDYVQASKEFGHPAEWASDMKRRIADVIDEIANGLRDHRGDTPANPHRAEGRKVATEHRYLTAQFESLCTYPAAADSAEELEDLHGDVRRALGQTRPSFKLDTPCPQCGLITMQRTVDLDRSDRINCMNCGHTIEEQYYPLYMRMVLEDVLGFNDTPNTTPAA